MNNEYLKYITYHRQFLGFHDQLALDYAVKQKSKLHEDIKHLQERLKYEEKVIKRLVQKTAGKTQASV